VIGVIGRNGAGKSTLLKILAQITRPTRGTVRLSGRVSSLLEVGTGFHPDLTGRENVYLNGTILGMSKAEIDRKFDEIVAFAGIEKFIDTVVKRYSSGMQVRLAFAVAAHLEPEILLIDEVLAVGDVAFQRKCLNKMDEVGGQGRTVLFVSHNMAPVRKLCGRALVLDAGRVAFEGPVDQAVERYLSPMTPESAGGLAHRVDRRGNGRLRFEAVALMNAEGDLVDTVESGEAVRLRIRYAAESGRELKDVLVCAAVDSLQGERVFMLQTDLAGADLSLIPPRGAFVCDLPRLSLNAGAYSITLYATVQRDIADWVADAVRVHVVAGDFFGTGRVPESQDGLVFAEHRWLVEESA
jgi:lipopolysaccharide transport system ATP-binding protein